MTKVRMGLLLVCIVAVTALAPGLPAWGWSTGPTTWGPYPMPGDGIWIGGGTTVECDCIHLSGGISQMKHPYTDALINDPDECTNPYHSGHEGWIWLKTFGTGPITTDDTEEEPGDGECDLEASIDYLMEATGPGSATGTAWGQSMIDGTWGDEEVLFFADPDEGTDTYSATAADNSIYSPSSYKLQCQAKSTAEAGPKSNMGTAHAEVDYGSVDETVTVTGPE